MPLSLTDALADLPDPRRKRNQRHELIDILLIAVCAVLGGANTWEQIAAFGVAKRDWFATFLDLPNGIPSHDTLGRVFAALDPAAFQDAFLAWMRENVLASGPEAFARHARSALKAAE